jgi:hypothetical protein
VDVSDARPWWASDLEDGVADAAPPRDPLEAHRAARRGAHPSDDTAAGWDDDLAAGWDLADLFGSPSGGGAPSGAGTPDDAATDDRVRDPRAGGRGPTAADDPAAAHGPDVCGVCPICVALRALGESRPQLLEHLTEAARHLTAAVRNLVEDPPRVRPDGARRDHDDPDPFERIDLD